MSGPGGDYDVEPTDVAGARSAFVSAGADVTRALEDLRATLGGLGDYLGSDEQGQAFKAAYEPKVAEAEQVVGEIGRGLSAFGPALASTAEQYRTDDAAARAAIDGQVRP